MHERTILESAHLTEPELATFLAARAIAYATAFLDGRDDAEKLASHANALQIEMLTSWSFSTNHEVSAVLNPVRLLVVSMRHAASASGETRQDRWQQVMGALVELVRQESRELREAGGHRA